VVWAVVVWRVEGGRKDETLDEPLDDACDIAHVHSAAPANSPLCRVPLSPVSAVGPGGRRWRQQTNALSAACSSNGARVGVAWIGHCGFLIVEPKLRRRERE
jgi:hypothetical protein